MSVDAIAVKMVIFIIQVIKLLKFLGGYCTSILGDYIWIYYVIGPLGFVILVIFIICIRRCCIRQTVSTQSLLVAETPAFSTYPIQPQPAVTIAVSGVTPGSAGNYFPNSGYTQNTGIYNPNVNANMGVNVVPGYNPNVNVSGGGGYDPNYVVNVGAVNTGVYSTGVTTNY